MHLQFSQVLPGAMARDSAPLIERWSPRTPVVWRANRGRTVLLLAIQGWRPEACYKRLSAPHYSIAQNINPTFTTSQFLQPYCTPLLSFSSFTYDHSDH